MITTARLKGLESDLGLTDLQYSIILSVLCATYCPAQVPSNMTLNYFKRPSVYIGGCVVLWSVISALTGVTHLFREILACRLCLGIPEAAFYPGGEWSVPRFGVEGSDVLALEVVYEEGIGVPVGDFVLWASHLECVRFGACACCFRVCV